jgi:hypothetical protein
MKSRFLLLLLGAAALAGCASFDRAELTHVRSRGVSARVVAKLDRGRPLAPVDVIELTQRGVPPDWIIRQIEDHGVDSIISRSDVLSLRRAGVRSTVIDAMLRASDRFADDFRYRDSAFVGPYYGDPFYSPFDPYPGYWSGGIGATFILPRHGHHHHHHHHR